MTLAFDQPLLLLLGLAAIPVAALGWAITRGMDRTRRLTVVGLRSLLVVLLAVALAGPQTRREHDELTVVAVVDVSGSVRRFAQPPPPPEGGPAPTYVPWVRQWLAQASVGKRERDRLGIVVFDGDAAAALAPAAGDPPEPVLDVRQSEGTSIEEAVRLGLAMLPRDTSGRLVLVTDGNETTGRAVDAAAVAAAGRAAGEGGATALAGPRRASDDAAPAIPIDVLPVVYRVPGDVRVAEVSAPTTAQPGQVVNARVVLESARPASGRLVADVEGLPVDLNGSAPGRSRRVSLPAGRSVVVLPVPLGTTPINRIAVAFVPDAPAEDALAENNAGVAITATPGTGRILVVSRDDASRPPVASLLAAAELEHEVVTPAAMPDDLLGLQDHDLVVLDDVPASDVPVTAQEALARHVQDLGGGLLMLGGLNSFGAGGWTGTPVAEVLPLDLDPPADLVLPSAALVLVLDESGSMARPVAGARASQQELANESAARAIESLRSDSLVGVISFSSMARTVVELRRNDEPTDIADAVRGISPGGGTDIRSALGAAEEMLVDVDVDRKFVILLTDGRSPEPGVRDLAERMATRDIRITTIGVGDDIDAPLLESIADIGGGEFVPVVNPRSLPRVLVDSVQIVNRPLIKESTFRPVVLATGSTIGADLSAVPTLQGLVVTGPRPEPDAVIEATHPDGEPLLARWQAGLGRVSAFTSDYGREWTPAWPASPSARTFLLRLIRETTRPRIGEAGDLRLDIEDGRLSVVLEAVGEDGPRDFLVVEGTVFTPDGPQPVRLRQTAPGRYETDVDASLDGEYVVALAPRSGNATLPPSVGGIATRRGAEFARLDTDLELLDRVVEATGGRRLDPEQPAEADLFDRTDLPTSVSLRPAWPILLALLLGTYLADVATRRIAWSGTAIRRRVTARLAHLRASEARGAAAATTAAALRSQSAGRRGGGAPDAGTIRAGRSAGGAPRVVRLADRADGGDDAMGPGGAPASAAASAASGDGRAGPARDARPAAGAPTAPPTDAPTPGPGEPAEPPRRGPAPVTDRRTTAEPPAPKGDGDATSPADDGDAEERPSSTRASLLAAKRRARDRLSGGDD